MHNKGYFYIPSLSSRTIIYKGLLLARQIGSFYKDLSDKNFKSALALIHQRYSTNTFPTWDLAQPFRYLAHNGEINTIMGNRNWMNAREGVLKSDKFKDGLEELFPILTLNHGIVNSADIEKLIDTEDEVILRNLIEKHFEYTESKKSKMILDNWDKEKFNIVRVIPKMYKKLISEYQAV